MAEARHRVLVLSSPSTDNDSIVEQIRRLCEVTLAQSMDHAVEALRSEHYDAIFSDASDFLPLERALVSQQANLILNTIGEGVCIVDGEARCNWMNKKMQAWPARVHEKIRRTCQDAFELFSRMLPAQLTDPLAGNRSKRYSLNIEDQQYMEMIASPVISPIGRVVQIVAVVWDSTGSRRLQQKIDAIDKAGRELVRLESEALSMMNAAERLKLLEEKIVSYTRQLLQFDHFTVRLLDRQSNKLEVVISYGLPSEALEIELLAEAEGNGISGFVATTGRSYICSNTEKEPRYVVGLDDAKSSLTVPLQLHDKVIGVLNIESRRRDAFNDDDRQFAEIFGRYIAIALNILDLMVVERAGTAHKVADDVCSSIAGPLNDISSDVKFLLDDCANNEPFRNRLLQVLDNVGVIRQCMRQATQGPHTILGAENVEEQADPLLAGRRILIADDDPNIRLTIGEIMRKYKVHTTLAASGAEAIELIQQQSFNLIISDIKMPDKTGYDVFAAARRQNDSIPVILMTGFGYDPHHSIVRASQEGLAAVLFKPFKVEQLIGEIRKAARVK